MIKISHVIQATSEITGIRIPILISQIRTKDISHARQMGMYVAREITLRSYPQIAQRFGDRDHTTVMYGYHQVIERLKVSPFVRIQCDRIAIRAKELASGVGRVAPQSVLVCIPQAKPDGRMKQKSEMAIG